MATKARDSSAHATSSRYVATVPAKLAQILRTVSARKKPRATTRSVWLRIAPKFWRSARFHALQSMIYLTWAWVCGHGHSAFQAKMARGTYFTAIDAVGDVLVSISATAPSSTRT